MTTQTLEVSSTRTIETLQQLVKGAPAITQEYLDRLATVLGREDYKSSFAAKMAVGGFHWTVTLEDLLKGFRYAAALSGGQNIVQQNMVGKLDSNNAVTAAIVFTGFVPAFALDKIMQAQKAGIHCFTIHSNERLPVEEVLAQNDPVVIGWDYYPYIVTTDGEKFAVGRRYNSRQVGAFITGWDLEKEFQLPAPTSI